MFSKFFSIITNQNYFVKRFYSFSEKKVSRFLPALFLLIYNSLSSLVIFPLSFSFSLSIYYNKKERNALHLILCNIEETFEIKILAFVLAFVTTLEEKLNGFISQKIKKCEMQERFSQNSVLLLFSFLYSISYHYTPFFKGFYLSKPLFTPILPHLRYKTPYHPISIFT